ncbi:hypothetical protein ACFWP3_35370 [Streptomyces sp. NPDC058525]|uniref:hypothetical protein n=1 Tax=Streptomyces sp. NPDC058525 TaxID=3346538 RepID=UPI0036529C7F
MDAPDLAAMAAQALSAAVSGAANTAAADLVRGRLGRSDRGRAAVDELISAPDSPEANRGVQAALAEEISSDSEFAERLALLLHASSAQHTGSVILSSSKVTRSQISLGPLTINNTPGGRLSLGAYGGVRLFGSTDDAPRGAPSQPGAAPSVDHAAGLPPTAETVRQILPDRGSMDATEYPWAGTPEVRTSAAGLSLCKRAPECENNATAVGRVEFGRSEDAAENRAEFLVLAFPDAAAAHRAYVDVVEDIEELRVPTFIKVELERRGEESQGLDLDGTDTRSNPAALHLNRSQIFRQGAFIGIAHQLDDPTEQRSTRILKLSATLADRLRKAGVGEVP